MSDNIQIKCSKAERSKGLLIVLVDVECGKFKGKFTIQREDKPGSVWYGVFDQENSDLDLFMGEKTKDNRYWLSTNLRDSKRDLRDMLARALDDHYEPEENSTGNETMLVVAAAVIAAMAIGVFVFLNL